MKTLSQLIEEYELHLVDDHLVCGRGSMKISYADRIAYGRDTKKILQRVITTERIFADEEEVESYINNYGDTQQERDSLLLAIREEQKAVRNLFREDYQEWFSCDLEK